jgi:glycosyltransferase involved in cell wall biosynthesis
VAAVPQERGDRGDGALFAARLAIAVVKNQYVHPGHSVAQRMPIALVTNYIPPYRVPLYRLLHERYGVEVHCFGGEPDWVPESLRDLDRQLAEAPFPAHRLARERDARVLAERNDAVIASIAGRVALPSAYRGARRARTPFVLWASLWRHPLTLAHSFSMYLMHRIYKRSDAIVTYGNHVSRYVARYRKTTRGIFVAPQAVEPEVFAREVTEAERLAWTAEINGRAGRPADAPIVLFVGRLVEEKGVGVLLSAWRELGRDDATLCVAGDGPLAETGKGLDGVVLAGRIERADLPAAYASATALAVPSLATRRFLEPWGLVCNEAMHQGTPVIASAAVGAVPGALVLHGVTGLVVRQGDAAELATAIGQVLDDRPLRERLSTSALAVIEGYSYEAAADAFGEALAFAGVPPQASRA